MRKVHSTRGVEEWSRVVDATRMVARRPFWDWGRWGRSIAAPSCGQAAGWKVTVIWTNAGRGDRLAACTVQIPAR